jgi:Plasmid pRiA4b ORF-3-like protein
MAAYVLRMKHDQPPPMIYQLRIVLRDISPLIWRRLLVYSDTTLAHLHHMLQILFAWSDEHLHHFHIFGKDYGSNAADTRHVTLQSFAFQPGERFCYI